MNANLHNDFDLNNDLEGYLDELSQKKAETERLSAALAVSMASNQNLREIIERALIQLEEAQTEIQRLKGKIP